MPPQSKLIAGRYQIADLSQDLLGQGSMGSVYRAADIESGLPELAAELMAEMEVDQTS